ncbi:MAG: DUF4418 family protein [Oscillospiraceae bacterium]|nr:DUF4418 family protein [Oscillospiraceae bacterium]
MKQFSPGAAAALLLSVVIAVGSVSFLGPCVHEDGSFGACHWAGQAMLGIGLLLAVLSLAALLVKDGRLRAGILFAAAAAAVLGLFVPGTLIRLCGMATMRCRSVMRPAMMLLCALTAGSCLLGGIAAYRKAGSKT